MNNNKVDGVDYEESPFDMNEQKLKDEIRKLNPKLNTLDPKSPKFYFTNNRINQCQNELTRLNIELSSSSSSRNSKIAIIISIMAVSLALFSAYFSILDYYGDKEWQDKQLKELGKINYILTKQNNLSAKEIKIIEEKLK